MPSASSASARSEPATCPLRLRMRRYSNPRKPKLSPFRQIDFSAFLLVDLNSEFCQFLPQPFLHRPNSHHASDGSQSTPPCHPQIASIEHWVFPFARGRNRLFQHSIYLREIEVTEHWRNHPALRNSLLPVDFRIIFRSFITDLSWTRRATFSSSSECCTLSK